MIENEIKHVKLTFENTEGAIKKENPEKLATQDEDKQSKSTTQW